MALVEQIVRLWCHEVPVPGPTSNDRAKAWLLAIEQVHFVLRLLLSPGYLSVRGLLGYLVTGTALCIVYLLRFTHIIRSININEDKQQEALLRFIFS